MGMEDDTTGPVTPPPQQELTGRPDLPPGHEDFYQRLRARMQAYAAARMGRSERVLQYVMAGPDLFHLLCCLVLDRSVSLSDKAILGAAIAYFVTPLDLVPDILFGPAGFLDDVALAAYVLRRLLRSNPEAVRRHWAGDGDVFAHVEALLDGVDRAIGVGRWKQVLRYIERAAAPAETPPRDVTPPEQPESPAH